MNTTLLGRWGEALCAEYLRKKKYKIVAVNYRSRFGEIDIIAETKTHIVFCEVKLRKNDRYAKAYEYVTASKQRKIKTTAQIWLSQHATENMFVSIFLKSMHPTEFLEAMKSIISNPHFKM